MDRNSWFLTILSVFDIFIVQFSDIEGNREAGNDEAIQLLSGISGLPPASFFAVSNDGTGLLRHPQ